MNSCRGPLVFWIKAGLSPCCPPGHNRLLTVPWLAQCSLHKAPGSWGEQCVSDSAQPHQPDHESMTHGDPGIPHSPHLFFLFTSSLHLLLIFPFFFFFGTVDEAKCQIKCSQFKSIFKNLRGWTMFTHALNMQECQEYLLSEDINNSPHPGGLVETNSSA